MSEKQQKPAKKPLHTAHHIAALQIEAYLDAGQPYDKHMDQCKAEGKSHPEPCRSCDALSRALNRLMESHYRRSGR